MCTSALACVLRKKETGKMIQSYQSGQFKYINLNLFTEVGFFMSRKSKFSAKEKLEIIKQYLSHEKNITQLSKIYKLSKTIIGRWIKNYRIKVLLD